MLKRTIVLALAVASSAFAAGAQTSLDPKAMFATADTNGDGDVSRAEFLAARSARFDALDANRDGTLSSDEFSAAAQGLRGRIMAPIMFGQFDASGDGKVTREEFAKAPTPGFDSADANGDGKVSQAEVRAAAP
jgi:Ca2+-binding EF-hand superfamily protein